MVNLFYNRNTKITLFMLSAMSLLGVSYYVFNGRLASPTTSDISFDIKHALTQPDLMPIVIIGSGCAGWSAGIYAARSGIKTLVIEGSKAGGQLVTTSYVENVPGVPKSMGKDIIDTMAKQAKSFGAMSLAQEVVVVDMHSWPYKITTDAGSTINALSIIITTGAVPKRLGIQGEQEYWGKGVTTCAICDAAFHKDHEIIVVGGGDSALEQVLQLSAYAKSITLLVRGSSLRASSAMQHHVLSNPKLSIRYNTHLKEIIGDGTHVQKAVLQTKQGVQQISVQGVFLAIGHEPATALFKDALECDKEGYLVVKGHTQHTSRPGVFAAGDVHDKWYRQAGVASGNGIKAALDALNFLQSIEFSTQHQTTMAFFNPISKPLGTIYQANNNQDLDNLLSTAELPIILDCYTNWCPACKNLEKILQNVAPEFSNKALFVKANVQNIPEIADKYAVNSVPSLFILSKDRAPIRYKGSATTPHEVKEFLTSTIS